MLGRVVTNFEIEGMEYRLVGGQKNGRQISLQSRTTSLPAHNKAAFKEIKPRLRINRNGRGFELITPGGETILPHTGEWPQQFLEDHLTKLRM